MADLVDKFYSGDLSESEEEALDGLLASSPEAAERFAQKAAEAYDRYGLPNPDSGPRKVKGWRGKGLFVLALVLMAGYGLWRTLWEVKPSATTHMPGFNSNQSSPSDSGNTGVPDSMVSHGLEKTATGISRSANSIQSQTKGHSSLEIGKGEQNIQVISPDLGGATVIPPVVSSPKLLSGPASNAGLKNGLAANSSDSSSVQVASANLPGQTAGQSEVQPPQTPATADKAHSRLKIDLAIGQSGPVTVRILDSTGADVKDLYSGSLAAGTYAFTWDGKLDNGKTAIPGKYQIESRNESTVQTREFWIQKKMKTVE